MTPSTLVAAFLIALGGAAIAVQAPLNAALARGLGHPAAAAAVSFGVGFLALVGLLLVTGGAGSLARITAVPAWQLTGGFLGAYYVVSVIWGVPKLGVVSMIAALIFGQMVAALALDATGAFGTAVKAVSMTRLIAVALVAAGLVVSRL